MSVQLTCYSSNCRGKSKFVPIMECPSYRAVFLLKTETNGIENSFEAASVRVISRRIFEYKLCDGISMHNCLNTI